MCVCALCCRKCLSKKKNCNSVSVETTEGRNELSQYSAQYFQPPFLYHNIVRLFLPSASFVIVYRCVFFFFSVCMTFSCSYIWLADLDNRKKKTTLFIVNNNHFLSSQTNKKVLFLSRLSNQETKRHIHFLKSYCLFSLAVTSSFFYFLYLHVFKIALFFFLSREVK